MKTDFDIQRAIQDELHWNPRVNAAAIGVAVNDGVVTLTGHVPQLAERKAAVRCAQRVAGVKGLVDHLEVHLPGAGERADADIAKAALNVLAWNSFVPAANISVAVHDGWITLAGEVEWQYQRMAAEEAVHALWGVRGVTNTITVRSLQETGIVKDHLEAAFQRRARLQGKKIDVEVHGQKVILSGHVNSLDEWGEADAGKLRQVLVNLCKNAVEAMPEGGALTVRARRSSSNQVQLHIRDTGSGIPEGVNIFEPFMTTKPGGTGLGLPVVRQIVAAHDGELTYRTAPGEGTTFTVTLVAVDEDMRAPTGTRDPLSRTVEG